MSGSANNTSNDNSREESKQDADGLPRTGSHRSLDELREAIVDAAAPPSVSFGAIPSFFMNAPTEAYPAPASLELPENFSSETQDAARASYKRTSFSTTASQGISSSMVQNDSLPRSKQSKSTTYLQPEDDPFSAQRNNVGRKAPSTLAAAKAAVEAAALDPYGSDGPESIVTTGGTFRNPQSEAANAGASSNVSENLIAPSALATIPVPDSPGRSHTYESNTHLTPLQIASRQTYSFRALVRKTLSYQKRQLFVNICCIGLCPFIMVALSFLLSFVGMYAFRKSFTLTYSVYCSNVNAMDPHSNLPATDYPQKTSADFSFLPEGQTYSMRNDYQSPIVFKSGPNKPFTVSGPQSCVLWTKKSNNFDDLYQQDPYLNVQSDTSAPATFINTYPVMRPILRLDTTFQSDLKYSWLNPMAVSSNPILLAKLAIVQSFPWFIVLEPSPNVDLGWKNMSTISNVDVSQISQLVSLATGYSSGFLGSIPAMIYINITAGASGPGANNVSQQNFALNAYSRYPAFAKLSSENISEDQLDSVLANIMNSVITKLSAIDDTVTLSSSPSQIDLLNFVLNVDTSMLVMPWGALIFETFNPANRYLKLTLQLGSDSRLTNVPFFPWPQKGFRLLISSGMITSAFVGNATNQNVRITQGYRIMPEIRSDIPTFDIGTVLGRALYPLGLSFLIPVMVVILVQEKEDRILAMMLMNGVKTSAYFMVHSMHFLIMTFLAACMFIVAGLVFRLEFFLETSPAVYIILLLLWCFAQVAVAFFISSFFSTSRTALVYSYVIVAAGIIVGIAGNNIYTESAPLVYMLWPPFAFYLAIGHISDNAASFNTPAYTFETLMTPKDIVGEAMLALFFMSIVLIVLAYYLQKVLPSQFGVRKPWHFPVTELMARFSRKSSVDKASARHSFSAVNAEETQYEDDDVRRERQEVDANAQNMDYNRYPLMLQHMRKVYKITGKVAVKDITLAVQSDTIFGLLGPNGAGKTSLISILTGIYEQTSGHAVLAGFDTVRDREKVYKIAGICPQHDILWRDLTIEEHLLFYARVKGIKPTEEVLAVKRALESVRLTEFKDRLTFGLSGGQRRRLSIAIALIGDPKVVFFDEPTTGLDPEVRRTIWDIIQHARQGRTLVLTTHSMEEAEALCGRIGIMARGTLRCIGPVLRLKQLYGTGFKLIVQAQAQHMAHARKWIETSVLPPKWTTTDIFQNSITYEFEPSSGDLARIFTQMQSESKAFQVQDWGLSQSSLEEVFLKLVTEEDAEGSAE